MRKLREGWMGAFFVNCCCVGKSYKKFIIDLQGYSVDYLTKEETFLLIFRIPRWKYLFWIKMFIKLLLTLYILHSVSISHARDFFNLCQLFVNTDVWWSLYLRFLADDLDRNRQYSSTGYWCGRLSPTEITHSNFRKKYFWIFFRTNTKFIFKTDNSIMSFYSRLLYLYCFYPKTTMWVS